MPSISDDSRLLDALGILQTIAPSPAEQQAALREAALLAEERASIWRGGVEPMPFDVYCEFIDGAKLTPRQYQVFADTGLLSAYSWISPERCINEVVLCWGKGSGKGWTSAKCCSYLAYVVQSMAVDPASYITSKQVTPMAKGSKLDIVNVAPNEELARDVFFHYLKQFLAHDLFGPFKPRLLAESVVFCTDEEWEAAKKQGRAPLYSLGVFSKNSRSSGLDGFNLIFWFMDEADAFLSTEKKCNASDIHDIFRSSAATRMGSGWTGIVASYPRVEAGFMETLYERARRNMQTLGPKASYYADKAATWEVRPGVDREHVPAIEEDYQNDPTAARAKYECLPMAAESAFFEFPEKIVEAVDSARQPAALVDTSPLDMTLKTGKDSYFVTATISNIQRVPGYSYFLAGDAGRTSDSYALAVFHVDGQAEGCQYLCDMCGRDPALRTVAQYRLFPRGEWCDATSEITAPTCGICGQIAGFRHVNRLGAGSYWLSGWWGKTGRDESTITDSQGRKYSIGHIYEDLLIEIQPTRATRPGEVNRPIYMPGVQTLCQDIITGFGVTSARFDPWQTAQLTDGLKQTTGGDIDEISFSNPEQYRRAKLVKTLLYNGLLTLLPNVRRDRQWRRLQLVGANKVDHPAGEAKDLFDAESVAIWAAATNSCGQLSVDWA